ncbi:ATP-dependent nuclease [Thioalkalivibrio sp. HK1]|uniref:ATP-dependent nuclease n=1 Tax=Thioalkalivibrio sp. HK1 TaxID=1469245 RepID=UPI000471A7EE|nr:ATP-binding protein [Thioalkalivibrio sp. HK1]
MQFDRVVVKEFKKLKKIELELANLNILVGTNGSGKSSVLQAIHFAVCLIRQTTKNISSREILHPDQIDYLPTNEYEQLGHDKKWANRKNLEKSDIHFLLLDPSNSNEEKIEITIQQAKNTGIAVVCNTSDKIISIFRKKNEFFSAYIPGITGIPNEEEKFSERVVLRACSFGHANTYLRNALLLLKNKNKDGKYLYKLQDWISQLIGEEMKIDVSHNDKTDLTISVRATFKNHEMPLELLGMGYLQIIQIFCYILLFEPKILLIDEPDIHLHPDIKMKIPSLLADIAKESDFKVIMATHSPFIVRGAPVDAKVHWMESGNIRTSNVSTIELALGWGVFGKEILLFSEDTDLFFIRKILEQWPERIKNSTAILPGNGYKNLPTPKKSKELKETLGNSFEIVVHRDRDAMTKSEMEILKRRYQENNIHLWITDYSDIESYFCLPEFLKSLTPDSNSLIEYLYKSIELHNKPDNKKFIGHRRSHNQEIYNGEGGSPQINDVWEELQSNEPLRAACGKSVFKCLIDKFNAVINKKQIQQHILDGNTAISLKNLLEDILKKSKNKSS